VAGALDLAETDEALGLGVVVAVADGADGGDGAAVESKASKGSWVGMVLAVRQPTIRREYASQTNAVNTMPPIRSSRPATAGSQRAR